MAILRSSSPSSLRRLCGTQMWINRKAVVGKGAEDRGFNNAESGGYCDYRSGVSSSYKDKVG